MRAAASAAGRAATILPPTCDGLPKPAGVRLPGERPLRRRDGTVGAVPSSLSAHARSWAEAAEGVTYERGRPGYPPAVGAVLAEQLGLRPGATVVDVAAGTGKLTRVLAHTGAATLAVEPMPGMRLQLRQTVPAARLVAASAEQLPLRSGRADAITVAQAFHWFDLPVATAEFRRVLRPGGGWRRSTTPVTVPSPGSPSSVRS